MNGPPLLGVHVFHAVNFADIGVFEGWRLEFREELWAYVELFQVNCKLFEVMQSLEGKEVFLTEIRVDLRPRVLEAANVVRKRSGKA